MSTVDQTATSKRLQQIPNVGPATARDLIRLGITEVAQLADRDPDVMYQGLCTLDGTRHDPCVRDVFAAAVCYARGEPARPWWHFSRQRLAREKRSSR